MKTITNSEWQALSDDYKLIRSDGTHCVLSLEPGEGTCLVPVSVLDDQDAAILEHRVAQLANADDFMCGDFVRFPDGHLERVSFVAPRTWDDLHGVQTSGGGSWYLGDGYVSFSGGLNAFIPAAQLRPTTETRCGTCWFFHHDYRAACNGVDVEAPFRVYEYTEPR